MLKRNILIIVLMSFLALFLISNNLNSIIFPAGTIKSGKFRGLVIGSSKENILNLLYLPTTKSTIKIMACIDAKSQLLLVYDKQAPCNPWHSDIWIAAYPGLHNEIIELHFKDDRLMKVNFKRNMFSP